MLRDVGERISEIRRLRGLSQDELAELAKLSRISIARYEAGRFEPGAQALDRIADALEVTTDELLGREDRLSPFTPIKKSAVPIIGEIACGVPIAAEQNIEGFADLPEGVHADFALRCKGDSMTPTFQDGDLVLIRQQPEVENGQIAAVNIDNETTLKHLYRQNDGLLLIADNAKYAPIFVPADSDKQILIHGLAVGFTRLFE